jgi:hypothetical protein
MPSHHWGDAWFEANGNDLNAAISQVMRDWLRWGRLGSHGKEKYGTFRHHVWWYTGEWPVHELVNPGYVYYQWGPWAHRADRALGRVVQWLRVPAAVHWWQRRVYVWALRRACRRWPNVAPELWSDYDV